MAMTEMLNNAAAKAESSMKQYLEEPSLQNIKILDLENKTEAVNID